MHNLEVEWVRKNKFALLLILLISALYLTLRVPNLTLQSIFADEAIYIRWAQVMRAEPTLRFLPLSDGKTPLFMWLMIPLLKVFEDPLTAGRSLSVISGYLTLLGVLFLGWRFINRSVGLWAAFLYSITPFFVFFDRMALVDSMLSAFVIWSLNLAMLLIQYPRVDLAMLLGYFLGGGLLVKPTGIFSLVVLPVTLVSFDWLKKGREAMIIRLALVWILALVITFVIYNILRLGPGFSSLNVRNQDYIFLPQELAGRWLDPFIPHLRDLADWLPKLFTWPILTAIVIGAGLALFKTNRIVLTILGWALIPLIIQMTFLRTFTARYVLFSMPPLLLLAAYSLDWCSQRWVAKRSLGLVGALVIALSVLPLSFSYQLLTDPAQAPLPKTERRGYLEDWTAGYGLKEIASFLIEQSQKQGVIVVGTEGYFGTLPDGLQIYLDKYFHLADQDHQILVIGSSATPSAQVKEAARDHPTYFVANRGRVGPAPEGSLYLLKEYPKAKGDELPPDAILLFEVR